MEHWIRNGGKSSPLLYCPTALAGGRWYAVPKGDGPAARVQKVQRVQRVVVGGCAAIMIKPYNRPYGRWKRASPLPAPRDLPIGKHVTGFSVAQGLPTNPVPLPPRKRWQNKASLGCNLISSSKQSTGCCPTAPRGEGGAVRHQRGEGRQRRPIQQNVYHDLSSRRQDP